MELSWLPGISDGKTSSPKGRSRMTFVLPPLPFDRKALEPHMSGLTLGCHYDEHHRGYVAALNALTRGTALEKLSMRDVVLETEGDPKLKTTFQNAAQCWNHEFFWNSMKPDGGPKGEGELFERIVADFGSIDSFNLAFIESAATLFGSGWVWLVEEKQRLKVVATNNALPAITLDVRPVMVCDVWEHAYYLDHHGDRKGFVKTFLTHLANWDTALARLKSIAKP
jgi:superoxide dismutase, Fe-Mn family